MRQEIYFKLKNLWGCHPNSNNLLSSVTSQDTGQKWSRCLGLQAQWQSNREWFVCRGKYLIDHHLIPVRPSNYNMFGFCCALLVQWHRSDWSSLSLSIVITFTPTWATFLCIWARHRLTPPAAQESLANHWASIAWWLLAAVSPVLSSYSS